MEEMGIVKRPPADLSAQGFPVIEVDGRVWCSGEYLDAQVGGRMVIGVDQAAGMVWLDCEGGARVPLLCPYCGEAVRLAAAGLDGARVAFVGRAVAGFQRVEAAAFADLCSEPTGRAAPVERWAIVLMLSGAEPEAERAVPLALASVRRLAPRPGWAGPPA
jgi:hypothetical protein